MRKIYTKFEINTLFFLDNTPTFDTPYTRLMLWLSAGKICRYGRAYDGYMDYIIRTVA